MKPVCFILLLVVSLLAQQATLELPPRELTQKEAEIANRPTPTSLLLKTLKPADRSGIQPVSGMRNVLEYGAVGDGKTKDTKAIQAALDAGGIVHFPPGIYLSGSVYLRSNGGLDLAPGALLLASPDEADYNAVDFCPQNRPSQYSKVQIANSDVITGVHLVIGVGVQNVVIRGGGAISGNREAFYDIPKDPRLIWRSQYIKWRPAETVWICEGSDITVQDVRLYDAPFWTCLIQGCNNVRIDRVTVDMHQWTRNGDGITIDGCKNAVVTNCFVRSGDDCIVIKDDHRRLTKGQPCENVIVSNCVLDSICGGVRIGVGNGAMRNILCENLHIYSRIGCYLGINWGMVYLVENVTFSNIILDCETAVAIYRSDNQLKRPPQDISLRHLRFRNIRGTAMRAFIVDANFPVQDVVIEDFEITLRGPDYSRCPYRELPKNRAPVELHRIDGLSISKMRVIWDRPNDCFTSPINLSEISHLKIDDCDFGGRPEWGGPQGYPLPTEKELEYMEKFKQYR